MTGDLTAMIRAARKEAHRLSLRSREQERELQQVIVKLQEAEMWSRAREEQGPGAGAARRSPRQAPAQRAGGPRWVMPELG